MGDQTHNCPEPWEPSRPSRPLRRHSPVPVLLPVPVPVPVPVLGADSSLARRPQSPPPAPSSVWPAGTQSSPGCSHLDMLTSPP